MRKISLLFLSLLAFVNFVHAETIALDRPWILPLAFEKSSDPVVQQYNYYDFMWRSFIALNWPNVPIQIEHTPEGSVITSGYRGQPDKTRTPADLTAPRNKPLTVWETYKEPSEVFPTPDTNGPQVWPLVSGTECPTGKIRI